MILTLVLVAGVLGLLALDRRPRDGAAGGLGPSGALPLSNAPEFSGVPEAREVDPVRQPAQAGVVGQTKFGTQPIPWSWQAFEALSQSVPGGLAKKSLGVLLTHGRCQADSEGVLIRAELAITDAERELGLGKRHQDLKPDQGMLFIYNRPGAKTFWMKDTFIPLSIHFYANGGKRLSSTVMMPEPNPAKPQHLFGEDGPTTAVLEAAPEIARQVKERDLDLLCILHP
jgi:uncharacterized membrane protein (UPF0127 family)